ncbi:MAG: DUF58 domain-containing protein [Spirochaeta sp.]
MRPNYRGLLVLFVLVYLIIPVAVIQWFAATGVFVILLSHLYLRTILNGLRIYRRRSSIKAYRNHTTTITLVVENHTRLPVPMLAVIDATGSLHSDDRERHLIHLRPLERRSFSYQVKSNNRGRYVLGPLELRISDPLGFFGQKVTVPLAGEVIVYPELNRLSSLVKEGLPSGTMRVSNPLYEDVTRFRSIREYIGGDEMRRINWKASARTGKLHVSEYTPTVSFTGLICLNLRSSDYAQRGRYHAGERAVQVAAALVRHNLDRSQAVGIVTNGYLAGDKGLQEYIPPGGTDQHGVRLLEFLSCIEFSLQDDSVMEFLQGRIETGTIIQYVGPQLNHDDLVRLTAVAGPATQVELYYLPQSAQTGAASHVSTKQAASAAARVLPRVRVFPVEDYGEEITASDEGITV